MSTQYQSPVEETVYSSESISTSISHDNSHHRAISEDQDEQYNPTNLCSRKETNNFPECSTVNVIADDKIIAHNGDKESKEIESGLFSEKAQDDPCSNRGCTLGSYYDVQNKFDDSCSSINSEVKTNISSSDLEHEKMTNSAVMISGSQVDFDNSFLNESHIFNGQSTFMLDEELEFEQTTNDMDHLSLKR